MVELIKQVLAIIPTYFQELVSLVSGPKRFIAELDSRRELTIKKSLIFLAISFFIVSVLHIPLTQGDLLNDLAASSIFTLLNVSAHACVMYWAWRLVGGSAPLGKILPVYFYYAGVIELIMMVTYLVAVGGMKTADPAGYRQIIEAILAESVLEYFRQHGEELLARPALLVGGLIVVAGFGVAMAWLIAGWGAFRQLSGLPKLRSIPAGCLFVLFSVPVTVLTLCVAKALTPAPKQNMPIPSQKSGQAGNSGAVAPAPALNNNP